MYSIDLSKISLDEFEKIMRETRLLPSQKIILNHLKENISSLKNAGYPDLDAVQKLLKNKQKFPKISGELKISTDDLTIINRMINSFVVKVLPLSKIDLFSAEELSALSALKIRNTKEYFEAKCTGIAMPLNCEKTEYAFQVIDLLRVNGVGVDYAKLLAEIGIQSVADYNNTPSEVILEKVLEKMKQREGNQPTLGISDIDYCRRFTKLLDSSCQSATD